MDCVLSLAAADLDAEDLQRLALDLRGSLTAEAGVGAETVERPAPEFLAEDRS